MPRPVGAVGHYDPAKCAQRRRLAARTAGLDCLPVSLRDFAASGVPEGWQVQTAEGHLLDKDALLARLNARLAGTAEKPLTAEAVHLVEMEAGSSDRGEGPAMGHWLYLGDSTLRNVARAANGRGFSLMNAHRTGGLSTPSELPFGHIVSGRREILVHSGGSAKFSRVLLQGYMLRGVKPNGDQGPSTDDLYRGIKGGTVSDVSLGIYGGYGVCDVCGGKFGDGGDDLRLMDDDYARGGPRLQEEDSEECRHIPGTRHKMKAAEIRRQRDRGVPGGVATYTLEGAVPREVSAVYKGAVPGAGFRHALALGRSGPLPDDVISEILGAYSGIALSARDLRPRRKVFAMPKVPKWASDLFSFVQDAQSPAELAEIVRDHGLAVRPEEEPMPAPKPIPDPPDSRLAAMEEENRKLKAAFAARDRADAKDFGEGLVDRLFLQPTDLQGDAEKLYADLAADDRDRPLNYARTDRLKALFAGVPTRDFKGQKVKAADLKDRGLKVRGGAADAEGDDDPEIDFYNLGRKAAGGDRIAE